MGANLEETARNKAFEKYKAEKPEWLDLALEAMNASYRAGGDMMIVAIAKALEEAYAAGQAGDYPVFVPHAERAPKIVKRHRPTPPPPPSKTVRRRR